MGWHLVAVRAWIDEGEPGWERPSNDLPIGRPGRPDNSLPGWGGGPVDPGYGRPDWVGRPDNSLPWGPGRPGNALPQPPVDPGFGGGRPEGPDSGYDRPSGGRPGNDLPWGPGRPGNELPGRDRPVDPGYGRPGGGGNYPSGGPVYPGGPVDPGWGGGRPAGPDSGYDRPSWGGRPDNTLPSGGRPGNELPEVPTPKAYSVPDEPQDAPSGDGEWVIVTYGGAATWAWISKPGTIDNTLPTTPPPTSGNELPTGSTGDGHEGEAGGPNQPAPKSYGY